ncbi:MAG: hypothetical protein LHV68_05315 [Elusimicrobia bacterium]|nr:hypothetical protein [Candidatus Liberimonas magnetica]
MDNVYFGKTEVLELKIKVDEVLEPLDFSDLPEGWSKCPHDPMVLLPVFPDLKIKKGLVLRAYYNNTPRLGGHSKVYVMPESAVFPEPVDAPDLPSHVRRPKEALSLVMGAFEGNYSAWSYFCASILCREIEEFGRWWHALNWHTQTILFDDPRKVPPKDSANINRKVFSEWKFDDNEPADWRPSFLEEANKITVTFYTYSGFGFECIYRHVDVYEKGSYDRVEYDSIILAKGPRGYIF